MVDNMDNFDDETWTTARTNSFLSAALSTTGSRQRQVISQLPSNDDHLLLLSSSSGNQKTTTKKIIYIDGASYVTARSRNWRTQTRQCWSLLLFLTLLGGCPVLLFWWQEEIDATQLQEQQKRQEKRQSQYQIQRGLTTATTRQLLDQDQDQMDHRLLQKDDDKKGEDEEQEEAIEAAFHRLQQRKYAYKHKGRMPHWPLRGMGFLSSKHGVVLWGTIELWKDKNKKNKQTLQTGRVLIYPALNKTMTTNQDQDRNWCEALLLWVRVQGPEILAGTARTVIVDKDSKKDNHNHNNNNNSSSSCHWQFDFVIQKPGTYRVDVKMLTWDDTIDNENIDNIYNNKTKGNNNNNNLIAHYNPNVPFFPNDKDNNNNSTNSSNDTSNTPTTLATHVGFPGFLTRHSPQAAARLCAQVCARTKYCDYWSTPALHYSPTHGGCELYFVGVKEDEKQTHERGLGDATTDNDNSNNSNNNKTKGKTHDPNIRDTIKTFRYYFPQLGSLMPVETASLAATQAHGPRPESNSRTWLTGVTFLGCGYSFWKSVIAPCLDPQLDDSIYLTEQTFTVLGLEQETGKTTKTRQSLTDPASASSQTITPTTTVASALLRPRNRQKDLCHIDKHEPFDHGRWVTYPYPDETACPHDLEANLAQFKKLKYYPNILFKYIGRKPECWYRENMTALVGRCRHAGCGMVRENAWHSPLQKEQKWYGAWDNYDCEYMHLLDTELQFCIDERRIESIQVEGGGKSGTDTDYMVADYLRDYLQQRLSHVKMYQDHKPTRSSSTHAKPATVNISLHVWNITDLLSMSNSRQEWKASLRQTAPHDALLTKMRRRHERYWVESLFLTSERLPLVTASRAKIFHNDAHAILKSLGYRKISAFNMSSAFAYDAAAEMDGTHILGPAMKTVVTKLLHYVCRDYLVH